MDTRFVILTDTHFAPPGRGVDGQWWNRTLVSRSAEISEALITTVKKLSPDFIIHCGDFTHFGDTSTLLDPSIVENIKEGSQNVL